MSGERDDAAAVRSLLGAVRRRLWLERFVAALRTALWSWAAILAITAALHLAFGRPGLAAASVVAAVAGLAALGRATLRRPSEAESALYADRRLGGESAYTTWLEARADAAGTQHSPALQRLVQWTAAAAPRSRGALEALRPSWRLARPLAAAAICTVVAALVTALPATDRGMAAEATRPAREPPQSTEPVSLNGEDALARELAAELSAPLDSRVGSEDPGRGSMQRSRDGEGASAAAVAGESSADDARPPAAVAASDAAAVVETTGAASGSADEAGRAAAARASGSGREAGTSRDESAGTEGSRALQGALAVQRRDVIRPFEESARQADMGQAGIYEGDASALGAAAALSEPAAARPPAARHAVTLTPAEAAFAAAWAGAERAKRTQP